MCTVSSLSFWWNSATWIPIVQSLFCHLPHSAVLSSTHSSQACLCIKVTSSCCAARFGHHSPALTLLNLSPACVFHTLFTFSLKGFVALAAGILSHSVFLWHSKKPGLLHSPLLGSPFLPISTCRNTMEVSPSLSSQSLPWQSHQAPCL